MVITCPLPFLEHLCYNKFMQPIHLPTILTFKSYDAMYDFGETCRKSFRFNFNVEFLGVEKYTHKFVWLVWNDVVPTDEEIAGIISESHTGVKQHLIVSTDK